MPKIRDIVGVRFGKLTVVSFGDRVGTRQRVAWVCLCDCGGITNVLGGVPKAG